MSVCGHHGQENIYFHVCTWDYGVGTSEATAVLSHKLTIFLAIALSLSKL